LELSSTTLNPASSSSFSVQLTNPPGAVPSTQESELTTGALGSTVLLLVLLTPSPSVTVKLTE
jgi:hypothetical protein